MVIFHLNIFKRNCCQIASVYTSLNAAKNIQVIGKNNMQEAAVLHTISSFAGSGKIFCQRLNSSGKQRNALKIALKFKSK